jgi:C4-dicarboxylate-specific signal transduction histidine kinase
VIAHINISEIYMKLKDYVTALKYAQTALELSASQQDDTRIYGVMCYGNLLMEQRQFKEALQHLLQALEMSEKQENREISKEINYMISVCYEQAGDFRESLRYLKDHIKLEKQIFQESLSKRLEQIQSVYEEENQQLKAQQMIEKASRIATIGAMAAAITHEINQPLCAVKVSADAILFWKKRRHISFPDDIEESLQTISQGADLINDIIQHVRSFWHPQDEVGSGYAEMNGTIKKALGLLERQIFSHGIFLEVQESEPDMMVQILPVHLEQVIINIVINAVHALDDCPRSRKNLKISTGREKQNAVIRISDNACGIDPELQEKIFDPFYTSKSDGKGMGLGLSIVDNYLRKYKGSIKVENNKAGGATFIITLPLAVEEK